MTGSLNAARETHGFGPVISVILLFAPWNLSVHYIENFWGCAGRRFVVVCMQSKTATAEK